MYQKEKEYEGTVRQDKKIRSTRKWARTKWPALLNKGFIHGHVGMQKSKKKIKLKLEYWYLIVPDSEFLTHKPRSDSATLTLT